MAVFTDIASLVPTLGERLGEGASLTEATALMVEMTDAEVVAILREAVEVTRPADQIRVVAAGIIADRSSRASGHSGLAQSRGHGSPASFVQQLTGSTKGEASRDVRVGQALLEGERESEADAGAEEAPPDDGGAGAGAGGGGADAGAGSHSESEAAAGRERQPLWHEPLGAALRSGALTAAQYDAIRRGLGEPPVPAGLPIDLPAEESAAIARAIHDAWFQAAEQLVAEASERTVEELGAAARTIRDLLDPEGAEARFLARYEKRSLRIWRDADGVRHASIAFEDEGGAFFTAAFEAAMRPRRGGPRFVDSEEKARAAALVDDPRTNDQLAYDLFMDLVRAGVLADAESVFGARQAGVRLVQVVAEDGTRAPVAHTEDGLLALPVGVVEQRACESGYVPVMVDSCGNPLDVGREQRLFTTRQRIALAIRDGGCRWRGCDRPASYCEAHHIDEWHADSGRTDVDRGILLCRFHHMNLHHGRWRITRDGKGDFVLHHRDGEQFVLHRRAALSYAWAGIDPPPKRFRPAA
ncbi:HNH endonuclease signature motif containing protein [Microbacterium sp. SD291]|uniref:HNH endonuclease signature motif containing protein n=1 Tax=Microbacterium sp. SD291 TaxID=2782007 RepID=UPI001A95E858|nr:HNH endonuclease signature motif containing protein [Microbacterium sp. SD291]MBO0980723.1 DUF222 domain-containing protein [Microbacterium sp. SD291]